MKEILKNVEIRGQAGLYSIPDSGKSYNQPYSMRRLIPSITLSLTCLPHFHKRGAMRDLKIDGLLDSVKVASWKE